MLIVYNRNICFLTIINKFSGNNTLSNIASIFHKNHIHLNIKSALLVLLSKFVTQKDNTHTLILILQHFQAYSSTRAVLTFCFFISMTSCINYHTTVLHWCWVQHVHIGHRNHMTTTLLLCGATGTRFKIDRLDRFTMINVFRLADLCLQLTFDPAYVPSLICSRKIR